MKQLKRICLVQFYLFGKEQLDIDGSTAILGLNGSGKSTLLDAIQTVMNGAHGSYRSFNAQSSSQTSTRSLRDYCLGALREEDDENKIQGYARDTATTYISLGFADEQTGWKMTAGVCLSASRQEDKHRVNGLFICPNTLLEASSFVERVEQDGAMQELPLTWRGFVESTRAQLNSDGRDLILKDQPTQYVKELLHQLGPKTQRLDDRKFLRSFQKSLQLRDIESVDDYVRQHIVPATEINANDFGRQITQLRNLRQTIEETRLKIGKLNEVHGYFDQALKAARRRASQSALAAIYEQEAASEAHDNLEELLEATQENLEAHCRDLEADEARLKRWSNELAELTAQIKDDPDLDNADRLANKVSDLSESIQRLAREVARPVRELITGLNALPADNASHSALPQIRQALYAASEDPESMTPGTVGAAIDQALAILGAADQDLSAELDAARSLEAHLKLEREAQKGLVTNLSKGGALPGRDAQRAIALFDHHGIGARPLAELVTVSDPEWQPAIEAYLGAQLDDLVVDAGREKEAVGLIRNLPRNAAIYGLKVVQPTHVAQYMDQTPGSDFVASLISGSSRTAVAYVRNAMAGLHFAESEADLERFKKALTRDGMVSGGGGSGRRRLPEQANLRIGRKVDPQALHEARQRLTQLEKDYGDAASRVRNLDAALARIRDMGDASVVQERFHTPLEELSELRETRRRYTADASEAARKADTSLLESQAQLKQKHSDLTESVKAMREAKGRYEAQIGQYEKDIKLAQSDLDRATDAMRQRLSDPDYDPAIQGDYRTRIDDEYGDDPMACAGRAKELAAASGKDWDRKKQNGFLSLGHYLNDYNVTLREQRDDWRMALAWTREQIDRLAKTDLLDFEEQADAALIAAQDSFKRDIALKLFDDMQKMQHAIKDLNKLLDACPPFSQNERYRFMYKHREDMSGLRKYITQVATDSDDGLFSQSQEAAAPDIAEAMQRLEELATDPELADGKVPSALTDYREFYTFDLEIRAGDKVIGHLSKRSGAGSGGEHRTPFYVIAGASLAAAYRLDPTRHKDGCGLMLLDEAFYSMDNQNALAAARFLKALGLQLVMAAPESDQAKIATFCDTLYEIGRDEFAYWLDPIYLKPAAHELMTSDMPSEHPDLITQELERMAQTPHESI